MAITTTIISRTILGNKRTVIGKSVLSGDVATADVVTGMAYIESFQATIQGSSAKAIAVNESLPLSSGDVTVVTEDNNLTFYWEAKGR